jgi:hypothetical protein
MEFSIFLNDLEEYFIENNIDGLEKISSICQESLLIYIKLFAGVLRLFHVGLFHTVAPLCNSLRNDVASMVTYSSTSAIPQYHS